MLDKTRKRTENPGIFPSEKPKTNSQDSQAWSNPTHPYGVNSLADLITNNPIGASSSLKTKTSKFVSLQLTKNTMTDQTIVIKTIPYDQSRFRNTLILLKKSKEKTLAPTTSSFKSKDNQKFTSQKRNLN